ncbi:MAG: sulfurtransferase TusA family protein [Candidatus Abyssubacteria bacterium]
MTPEARLKETVEEKLNLKGVMCPLNFVKIKLKLEEMSEGQRLEVIVDDGEPMRNVPRSVKEEGHRILKAEKLADNGFKLVIVKNGDDWDGR